MQEFSREEHRVACTLSLHGRHDPRRIARCGMIAFRTHFEVALGISASPKRLSKWGRGSWDF